MARPERFCRRRIRSTPSTCSRSSSCARGERDGAGDGRARGRRCSARSGMHPLRRAQRDRRLRRRPAARGALARGAVARATTASPPWRRSTTRSATAPGCAGRSWARSSPTGSRAATQGMRHFLRQFGPALEWPWTQLTDVPELTDELVETIAAQSDAQAGGRSARELEQERDRVLVRLLQALRVEEIGAGATLAAWERGLLGAAPASARRVPAGVGRLQRPRPREPLPPALRRRDRRAARRARASTPATSRRRELLHGRDAPLAPAPARGRRPACT